MKYLNSESLMIIVLIYWSILLFILFRYYHNNNNDNNINNKFSSLYNNTFKSYSSDNLTTIKPIYLLENENITEISNNYTSNVTSFSTNSTEQRIQLYNYLNALNQSKNRINIYRNNNIKIPKYKEIIGIDDDPPSHAYGKYNITSDSHLNIILKQAYESINKKGKEIEYFNNFTFAKSFGVYYQYIHPNKCQIRNISLKYTPECGDNSMSKATIKNILVVATQRSGTHYMWEMLNRLGIDVHHEGVGIDGSVSWIYAVNSRNNARYGIGYFSNTHIINNPAKLSRQRFKYIFHQVRHPIRVITTLYNRCAIYDRFWSWISLIKGFSSINQDLSVLKRSMLLYILWNKHIERYADVRYRTETTSARDVCVWAGYSLSQCSKPVYLDEPIMSNFTLISKNISYVNPVMVKHNESDGYTHRAANFSYFHHNSSRLHRLYNNEYNIKDNNISNHVITNQTISNTNNNQTISITNNNQTVSYTSNNQTISNTSNKRPNNLTVDLSRLPNNPNSNHTVAITWDDLYMEDEYLANELQIMCIEYGYDLDPNKIPQSSTSHKYTA